MIMRLVAGSGRSGTTWVLDALANANDLRPVFEPLHPQISQLGGHFAHRALIADEEHPELRQFLDDAIHHGRCSLWTKYRMLRPWLAPPASELVTLRGLGQMYRRWRKFAEDAPALAIAGRRREPLVKCIYANLMLGWLSRQCRFRIVLVVRHPGAVIESELRSGWNPAFALERFRSDARLHELTGDRYRTLLARRLGPVESLAIRWVIENQVAMEQVGPGGIAVAFYERLKQSPEWEWKAICSALGLRWTPAPQIISKPSQQSSAIGISSSDDSIDSPRWMEALGSDALDKIQRVLDEAKCDMYSMRSALPRAISHGGPDLSVAGST